MNQDWKKFKNLLRDSRRILISAHVKCDGDALGSELALAAGLRHLGYIVTVVNPDLPSDIFRFIGKDFSLIQMYDGTEGENHLSREDVKSYDTLIIVDTSARTQLKRITDLADSGMKTLVIDHHSVSDTLTPHTFADASQPAAGCLVMELLESLGVPLGLCESGSSCSVADFLFFAIATDTGWFRFPAVKPETLMQAAKLMAAGASSARLYRSAYENYSPARLKLVGVVAQNACLECGGRLAYSWISRADFERFHASNGETTDIVNILQMTATVEVAVLFTEMGGGKIRLNFRSCGAFNVAEFARSCNGGGHKDAAGGSLELPLEEAVRTVTEALKNRILEQKI